MTLDLQFERREGVSHEKRLLAARQIAETEAGLSRAHAREDASKEVEPLDKHTKMARIALRETFYDITEGQGLQPKDAQSVLELFTEYPELENATLARIFMNGDWDAANGVERQLVGMMNELWDRGYDSLRFLNRDEPDPKRSSFIHAGFTPEFGLIALRRKRRLIIADSSKAEAVRPHLEVDKVSTFALDIDQFDKLSQDAANEVRLIVASAIFQLIDPHEFAVNVTAEEAEQIAGSMVDPEEYVSYMAQRLLPQPEDERRERFSRSFKMAAELRRVMRKYKIPYDDVLARSYTTENPNCLQNEVGLEFIENAIRQRSSLLTPASTTYYVHS